jgi:hypothetical protein
MIKLTNLLKEIFDDNKKGTGRRFIPQVTILPADTKDQFKEHFKLVKSADGEYRLYISKFLKDALESLSRGRTSRDTQKRLSPLAKMVSERMPQEIRGLLKKYSGKLNSGLQMFSINTKIKEVTPNGDVVFFNPGNKAMAAQAYDPTITEE